MSGREALCGLIQCGWLAGCIPEALRFARVSRQPLQITQQRLLRQILQENAKTVFGQRHRFAKILAVSDFQQQVALSGYDDYLELIERISDGEKEVLTADEVLMFELTSGSTAATKLIPYTLSLQQAFNRALHPWLIDLYLHHTGIWGGPSYWVITPKFQAGRKTRGGIKIGFAADSEYFGSWGKHLVDLLMAVPQEVAAIKDIAAWKRATLLHLLCRDDLRLISLWNPGFIFSLFEELKYAETSLATALSKKAGCKRAEAFAAAMHCHRVGDLAGFTRILWPKLALLSSWTEAEASGSARRLANTFPQAVIQTKGILATESAITIPMHVAPAPVLAARSAFFEFIESGDSRVKLAHEVETGGVYSLVITTPGGLYRYRLNDRVRVAGFFRNLPCLEFLGKEAIISDRCGEKLNAEHIKQIFASFFSSDTAAFIAPEPGLNGSAPYYCLFVCPEEFHPDLPQKIEEKLCENFHYDWCVKNGQLQPLQAVIAAPTNDRLQQLRLERMAQLGHQFSTVKTAPLTSLDGWQEWFQRATGPRPLKM